MKIRIFNAIAFAGYERDLDRNLRRLLNKLTSKTTEWSSDSTLVTGFSYAPKSIEKANEFGTEGVFYRFLDPIEEWNRLWPNAAGNRAEAEFRLMIVPTIDFQIISALWILKVGHIYDAVLDPTISYGNRLRRRRVLGREPIGRLNLDCVGLFPPYFSAYRQWRENGLKAMRHSLTEGQRILAVTMDLRSFYHRVSPAFLLRKTFTEDLLSLNLNEDQISFTQSFVNALGNWYSATPDYKKRPQGALPVGLSASKVIANVLLAELDSKIMRSLRPVYYGRYVDDIFLVLESEGKVETGIEVMQRLAKAMPEILRFEQGANDEPAVRLQLPYAQDSDLIFAGAKQKIFNLSGRHGLDLVAQIGAQIRQQSSEHRLLATVPSTSIEMASRALLAQSSASLEADAIRKADVVSVRRLGLALLLRDVEAYARDLHPKTWTSRRTEFYGLVHRHVLTPTGFFDFFSYTHRVLGLMVACGDLPAVVQMLRRLCDIIQLLENTTTAGTTKRIEFDACRSYYAQALNQVVLQATTVPGFRWPRMLLQIFNTLRLIDPDVAAPMRLDIAKGLSVELLHGDWGRRPYRDAWLTGATRKLPNPPVPPSLSLRRMLRLGAIRAFRKSANLRLPYWPALVFPTRPLNLAEITLAAPNLLQLPQQLRASLFALRGAMARSDEGVMTTPPATPKGNKEVVIDGRRSDFYRVAVPSFLTTDEEWAAALNGLPFHTLERYERTRRLINQILRGTGEVDYVIFPECSMPLPWARSIAYKLADRKVSLIAGLEYRLTPNGVRNDAFLSLATEWPWHSTSVLLVQPKCAPAHEERRNLYKAGRKRLFKPHPMDANPPVYIHGGLCFSVLLCSDLTNIAHRGRLQGCVDALFVLEWNKDIDTFSALVEATANDLHAYVLQSNNRRYGDSRIRIPRKKDYQRDIVRVRGGMHDYFVVASLDITSLRRFQKKMPTTSNGPFKPVPIGYSMSERRRSIKP